MVTQIDYSKDVFKSIDDLPECLKKVLYKFQVEGVAFGLKQCGRVLLCDEMGVGKTIQAIGLCSLYKENWPVMIICPTSLKFNWNAELLKWLGGDGLNKQNIQIISSKKDALYKVSKFIISSRPKTVNKKSPTKWPATSSRTSCPK